MLRDFKLFFSAITQVELSFTPENVKNLVKSMKSEINEFIEITDEAVDLATQYIAEKVIGVILKLNGLRIASRTNRVISWNMA